MCYNCGCELPDDPMGKGLVQEGDGSITESTFKHVAEKWNMTTEEAKKNVYDLLKKTLEK